MSSGALFLLADVRHEKHLICRCQHDPETVGPAGWSSGQMHRQLGLNRMRIRVATNISGWLNSSTRASQSEKACTTCGVILPRLCQDAQLAFTGLKAKLNGLAGVMRHWLGCNLAIAYGKVITRANHHAIAQPLELAAARGTRSEKDGGGIRFGERHYASAMIAVLMGHQNGIQI